MPTNMVGQEINLWWAEMGKELIEQQPEFRRRGRRPGSKNKSIKTVVEAQTNRQRRWRQKHQASAVRDDWVQIGNQTYLLPADIVASLEPFLIRRPK